MGTQGMKTRVWKAHRSASRTSPPLFPPPTPCKEVSLVFLTFLPPLPFAGDPEAAGGLDGPRAECLWGAGAGGAVPGAACPQGAGLLPPQQGGPDCQAARRRLCLQEPHLCKEGRDIWGGRWGWGLAPPVFGGRAQLQNSGKTGELVGPEPAEGGRGRIPITHNTKNTQDMQSVVASGNELFCVFKAFISHPYRAQGSLEER